MKEIKESIRMKAEEQAERENEWWWVANEELEKIQSSLSELQIRTDKHNTDLQIFDIHMNKLQDQTDKFTSGLSSCSKSVEVLDRTCVKLHKYTAEHEDILDRLVKF